MLAHYTQVWMVVTLLAAYVKAVMLPKLKNEA